MNGSWIKSPRFLLPLGSLVFGISLMAMPILGSQDPQTPPDNTKQNKDQTSPTADQQKMNPADRAITQKIRKAIHQDTSLPHMRTTLRSSRKTARSRFADLCVLTMRRRISKPRQ